MTEPIQEGLTESIGFVSTNLWIAPREKTWFSQVQEITKTEIPFWIVAAGGKRDFTIKWWDTHRFQQVINHFRGRVLFVQVGEKGHHHPALRGVLDLRGKTDLRQLVRLVYHAQGVLCPVTMLMHLAAAVDAKPGMPRNRACVVVAGGREPSQWEAYPHHQYIHTNGALRCCDDGGCWKARTVPLGDGDEKDKPENLCEHPVKKEFRENGATTSVSYMLPRCMDMITAEEVARRIELYFTGGAVRYLTTAEARIASRVVTKPDANGQKGIAGVLPLFPKLSLAMLPRAMLRGGRRDKWQCRSEFSGKAIVALILPVNFRGVVAPFDRPKGEK